MGGWLALQQHWPMVKRFGAGGNWGWERIMPAKGRDSSSFCCCILTHLWSSEAQHGSLCFCACSNMDTEPKRPIAPGCGLSRGKEQMLAFLMGTSVGIPAGPECSNHHFSATAGALSTVRLRIGLGNIYLPSTHNHVQLAEIMFSSVSWFALMPFCPIS